MALTLEQKQTVRYAIVQGAVNNIGVREDGPPYDNRGVYVDEYLAFVGDEPGEPWCLAFAEFRVDRGYQAAGMTFEDSGLLKTGYCLALADSAREQMRLIGADEILAGNGTVEEGDILLVWETFGNETPNDYHHSGIVEIAPTNIGAFQTIEGNSNTDGAAEGYEVVRQCRNLHTRASDGHAKYAFVRTVE